MNKRVALITGGAGFIGSHLAELLLKDDYRVLVIDDLSTGLLANIEHLLDNPDFDFFNDTVLNEQLVRALVKKSDHVYHLAAAVGVKLIVDEPVRTIETNIHGTEIVLDAANEFKKRILIASTSEIYGKNEKVPFCEDDDMLLGSTRFSRWSYACSKAIDEFLALAFHQQYGLEVIVTRFFNTIGPRQRGQYGMVVPRFVERALKGEPLEIYGDGSQQRCFSYVGDVIGGVKSLMECEKAVGEVYNLGSNEEISISELADLVVELTSSKSSKKFLTYEQAYGRAFDDMQRRIPSLEKAFEMVGYIPKHDLRTTLGLIIDDISSRV